MGSNRTWEQASHLLKLISDKSTPAEQIQQLYSSGLLSDLLDANIEKVNRNQFRQVLGLCPILKKNEHGQYIIEVTGRALTGAEEIELLTQSGFRISDYAKQCLLSTNPDSYDALHRLEDGKVYRVAIVPGREVKKNRTTANLQAHGQSFGYGKPLAGLIPRIRESVTDKQMEQMGIYYIAGLHDTIKDPDGRPGVLSSGRGGGGPWLSGFWGDPGYGWDDDGAFAFVVPDDEG